MRALIAPGAIVELRCPQSKLSGWYHRLDDLALDAYALSEAGETVYWTINPVMDDLLSYADHRYLPSVKTTSDRDIERRARLLIDVDPVRPANVSATDDEKAQAWHVLTQAIVWLTSRGWPTPAIVDSGNGWHAYYAIDLPAADNGLVANALKALSAKFSTDAAKIDTAVGNASRISKVPGTVSRKGDDTEDRPHRTSCVVSIPDTWVDVTREQLNAIAETGITTTRKTGNLTQYFDGPVAEDREHILKRAYEYLQTIPGAVSGEGGHNATLIVAIKLVRGWDLTDSEAFELISEWNQRCEPQWTTEELSYKIREAREKGRGPIGHLKDRKPDDSSLWQASTADPEQPKLKLPTRICAADLVIECPEPLPAVLGGILRRGELLGVISGSKVGKSWLCMSLSMAVIQGSEWMGKFQCVQGRVLLVDTEVQKQTLSHRWQKVCKAHGVDSRKERGLDMIPLRENPTDMAKLCRALLDDIQPGEFELIIIDSFYKLFGEKQDENSNACVGRMLSDLQAVASRLSIAIVVVHHTSKGSQGGKAVTDTGAGAGAFWRCIDSGLAIRQHEEDGIYVVDGVVRSFKALEPFCVKQDFPLWSLAPDSAPEQLKQDKPRGRMQAKKEWTPQDLVDVCPTMPTPWGKIEAGLALKGIKPYRAKELRRQAVDLEILFEGPAGSFAAVKQPEETIFQSNFKSTASLPKSPTGGVGDFFSQRVKV